MRLRKRRSANLIGRTQSCTELHRSGKGLGGPFSCVFLGPRVLLWLAWKADALPIELHPRGVFGDRSPRADDSDSPDIDVEGVASFGPGFTHGAEDSVGADVAQPAAAPAACSTACLIALKSTCTPGSSLIHA